MAELKDLDGHYFISYDPDFKYYKYYGIKNGAISLLFIMHYILESIDEIEDQISYLEEINNSIDNYRR